MKLPKSAERQLSNHRKGWTKLDNLQLALNKHSEKYANGVIKEVLAVYSKKELSTPEVRAAAMFWCSSGVQLPVAVAFARLDAIVAGTLKLKKRQKRVKNNTLHRHR